MKEKSLRSVDALVSLYPSLFPDGPLSRGFEISEGWASVLELLFERLQQILASEPGSQIKVVQVKEKFGVLRVYLDTGNVSERIRIQIAEAVALAEQATRSICEVCGNPGVQVSRAGYLRVRCTACRAEADTL